MCNTWLFPLTFFLFFPGNITALLSSPKELPILSYTWLAQLNVVSVSQGINRFNHRIDSKKLLKLAEPGEFLFFFPLIILFTSSSQGAIKCNWHRVTASEARSWHKKIHGLLPRTVFMIQIQIMNLHGYFSYDTMKQESSKVNFLIIWWNTRRWRIRKINYI